MNEIEYTRLIKRLIKGSYRLEKDFQSDVIRLARENGWMVHFTPKSKGLSAVDPGFHDLVLGHIEQGRILVRENKIDSRPLSDDQKKWRDLMTANGWDVGTYRSDAGIIAIEELT